MLNDWDYQVDEAVNKEFYITNILSGTPYADQLRCDWPTTSSGGFLWPELPR
jgi:hypothetical protein